MGIFEEPNICISLWLQKTKARKLVMIPRPYSNNLCWRASCPGVAVWDLIYAGEMRSISQLILVMLPLFNFHQHPHFAQYYSYSKHVILLKSQDHYTQSFFWSPYYLLRVSDVKNSCKLYIVTEWMTYQPSKYETKYLFSVPVQKVFKTSSPVDYYPDTRQMELNCTFKGWPRPRVVWHNPDKKRIINGSEGFYISEELVGKDILISLLRNLNIQEKHKGDYDCTATNNITGWSSKESRIIELDYWCKLSDYLEVCFEVNPDYCIPRVWKWGEGSWSRISALYHHNSAPQTSVISIPNTVFFQILASPASRVAINSRIA